MRQSDHKSKLKEIMRMENKEFKRELIALSHGRIAFRRTGPTRSEIWTKQIWKLGPRTHKHGTNRNKWLTCSTHRTTTAWMQNLK